MISLVGEKYGRLKVTDFVEYSKTGHTAIWLCECDCGYVLTARGTNLRSGHTRSCGCLQEETKGLHSITHGHWKNKKPTRTYTIWQSMKLRCLNPNHEHFKYYGGRGVTVCEEWLKFDNFLRDMGEAPDGLELDRIDNYSGYCKENCRWVTHTENMRNKRRYA